MDKKVIMGKIKEKKSKLKDRELRKLACLDRI